MYAQNQFLGLVIIDFWSLPPSLSMLIANEMIENKIGGRESPGLECKRLGFFTKTCSKITTIISFSRQNDTGSFSRALYLLERLVVILEAKGRSSFLP